MTPPSRTRFGLLLLCFFLWGFAALIYETAWTREFSFVFGTSELAIAAVLAAYMAGLALGAFIAGRLAPLLRRPVLAYGLLELGIALCALAVPLGIRGVTMLYVGWFGGGPAAPEATGLVTALFHLLGAFAVLVPCTALMGATLPLLARHAVKSDDEIGPRVGLLYAVNTLGAIAGTLCAAFLLLPELGLRQTVYVGVATNALVFVAASLLARTLALAPERPGAVPRARRWHWILPLMMLSGAASFAYEVLWTRLLSHILGGSTLAFATMLASFLLGIALGSAAAARLTRSRAAAAIGFAMAQLGTAVLGWLAFRASQWLPHFADSVGASGLNPAPGIFVAGAVLLPFTLCIGATFPFAVRLLTDHPDQAARSSAQVYAWNTLGSILGSVGAAFVLLPLLGLAGTLAVCVALNFALGAVAASLSAPRRWAVAAVAGAAGVAVLLLPPRFPESLLRRSVLNGRTAGGEIAYVGVGRSGTVVLFYLGHRYRVLTNGLPEAGISPADVPATRISEVRLLSMLPVLERPETRHALVVGLGGGGTLAGVPSSVESIDVIELEPEVIEANRQVPSRRGGDPLADPRVRLLVGDARGALMLSDTSYDAIISQPSHPWTSGASHLYTREFFELVRSRLAPGGVFGQWIGLKFVDEALLRSLLATLLEVFPHLEVFRPVSNAVLFMGSDQPLDIMSSARVAISAAPESFAVDGIHRLEDVAAFMLLDEEGSRALAKGAFTNTDDHNRLATRQRMTKQVSWEELFAPHDPLPERLKLLDSALLSRRLLETGQRDRLDRLLAEFPESDRQIGLGWTKFADGSKRVAVRHFERALASNPESTAARESLYAVLGPEALAGDPSERLSALADASRLANASEWERIAQLDASLAQWQPGELLFNEATRLRVDWRLRSGDSERGREAMELTGVLLARRHRTGDYLLLARTAKLAGRWDPAWAALGEFLRRHRGRPLPPAIAQEVRGIASSLPDSPYAEAVERVLERRRIGTSSGRGAVRRRSLESE
jgi:spermidine synthase